MKTKLSLIIGLTALIPCYLTGCSTIGSTAADLGLAGAGGIAGYKLTNGNLGGAAIGAAAGLTASKVAQSALQNEVEDAEKRGFDRAMNQAAKQQYWIIQNQQHSSEEPLPRYVPIQIPAQTINGVITNPRTEYIKVYQ
jgi:hypothetical protein